MLAVRRVARTALGLLLALCTAFGLLTAGSAPAALAQALLVRSSIAPGSLQPSIPSTLTLTFSEDLVASQSSLSITGPDGGSAVGGSPRPLPDMRSLTVALQSRGGGTYRVFWSAVSAEDGHVVSGAFTFAVGYVTATGDLQSPLAVRHATSLKVITFLSALARWLLLLVALAWAGGALLEISRGVSAARAAISGEDAWLITVATRARSVRYRQLQLLLLLLACSWALAAAELLTAGRVSFFGSLTGLFAGRLGLDRVIAFILPLLALFAQRAQTAAIQSAAPGAVAGRPLVASGRAGSSLLQAPGLGRWAQLTASSLFLLTLAWNSHAASVPNITLSAVLLAWLHSIGAAAWIGGMFYLVFTALPVLDNTELDHRVPLLLGLLRRYTVFAGAGIATLLVTGVFAVQVQVGTRAHQTGNAYGDTLLLKILLVVVTLVLTIYALVLQRGYVERVWGLRQRLESLAAIDRLGRSLRACALLGALVIGGTAVLWTDAPPSTTPLSPFGAPLAALPSGAWQPIGLRGRDVHRLLFQPGNRHVLFAATDAGVWRSTDDQHSWHRMGTALQKLSILDLLSLDNGRGLLAAAANGRLYRTFDGGRHWQALMRPFGHRPLRVLAQHGTVLIAAGDDGIFRSVDDSRHWHLVLPASGQGIATVYWSGAENQWLAGVERGPWQIYSADAGATAWQVVPGAPATGGGVLALASTAGPASRLLAGAGSGGWVAPRSTGSWSQLAGIAAGVPVDALLPDGRAFARAYLGTVGAGPYGTVDGGTTWAPLGANRPSTIANLVMRPGPTEILFAATSDGAYKLVLSP